MGPRRCQDGSHRPGLCFGRGEQRGVIAPEPILGQARELRQVAGRQPGLRESQRPADQSHVGHEVFFAQQQQSVRRMVARPIQAELEFGFLGSVQDRQQQAVHGRMIAGPARDDLAADGRTPWRAGCCAARGRGR